MDFENEILNKLFNEHLAELGEDDMTNLVECLSNNYKCCSSCKRWLKYDTNYTPFAKTGKCKRCISDKNREYYLKRKEQIKNLNQKN